MSSRSLKTVSCIWNVIRGHDDELHCFITNKMLIIKYLLTVFRGNVALFCASERAWLANTWRYKSRSAWRLTDGDINGHRRGHFQAVVTGVTGVWRSALSSTSHCLSAIPVIFPGAQQSFQPSSSSRCSFPRPCTLLSCFNIATPCLPWDEKMSHAVNWFHTTRLTLEWQAMPLTCP